jgi:hypothetical protein
MDKARLIELIVSHLQRCEDLSLLDFIYRLLLYQP